MSPHRESPGFSRGEKVNFMMVMYGLEGRHRRFVLAAEFGCLLSIAYGLLPGAWPFGVVELVWCVIGLGRFRHRRRVESPGRPLSRACRPVRL
jgi:hypothetical protein